MIPVRTRRDPWARGDAGDWGVRIRVKLFHGIEKRLYPAFWRMMAIGTVARWRGMTILATVGFGVISIMEYFRGI